MTTIVRWDPYKEMSGLQDRMNRLFEEVWGRGRRSDEEFIAGGWVPPVDVRETRETLEISAELPGIDPKSVDVSAEGGVLTVKGSRNFEKAAEGETYHRVERAYGAFERSFTLPSNVDADRIQAAYRHGVLYLTVPKREEAKPKAIAIKIEGK